MASATQDEVDVDPYDAAAAREMLAQEGVRASLDKDIAELEATRAAEAEAQAEGQAEEGGEEGGEGEQRKLWDKPYTRFHEVGARSSSQRTNIPLLSPGVLPMK
jgi:hypothetical protein